MNKTWQEKLVTKYKQLNLKKGEQDDMLIKTNSSLHDRSDGGRGSNVDLSNLRKKELNKNFKKGGKVMITKEAALDDLEKIDVNAPIGKVIVDVGKIIIKVLATIRSNQLLTDEEKKKIKEARAKRDTEKKE